MSPGRVTLDRAACLGTNAKRETVTVPWAETPWDVRSPGGAALLAGPSCAPGPAWRWRRRKPREARGRRSGEEWNPPAMDSSFLARWCRAGGRRQPPRFDRAMRTCSNAATGRDVAQSGSVPEWGSGGPGFKSRRPDQNSFIWKPASPQEQPVLSSWGFAGELTQPRARVTEAPGKHARSDRFGGAVCEGGPIRCVPPTLSDRWRAGSGVWPTKNTVASSSPRGPNLRIG